MLDQRSIDKVVLILLFFMSVCMSTVTANDPYDNHGESDSCSSAKTDWDDQEEDDEIIILDNFSLLNRYDFLTKNPWTITSDPSMGFLLLPFVYNFRTYSRGH